MKERIEIIPSSGTPKNIVLMSHGLNNSGQVLDEMMKLVDLQSSSVVRMTLSGHEGQDLAKPANWDVLWVDDMMQAMRRANELAKTFHIPLCFMGFSLSCIVFLNALEKTKIKFDRVIMMSPPLMISEKMFVIETLGFLGITALPSLNKPEWRVHGFLPMAMYRALFKLIRNLKSVNGATLPLAAIVLIDERDEMVNCGLIRKWISEKNLAWKIIPIAVGQHLRNVVRHLICAEMNAGSSAIRLIKDICQNFLLSGESIDRQLKVTPYEHFFLNEESEDYPISIVVRLTFHGILNKTSFDAAIRKAQIAHPMLRARINGLGFHRRKRLCWLIFATGFHPYMDWQEGQAPEHFPQDQREINLMQEVGLRVFARVFAGKTLVTLQFHHACLDDIGAMKFMRSVFDFYENPLHVSTFPRTQELEGRAVSCGSGFRKILMDLALLIKFNRFKAEPIGAKISLAPPRGKTGLLECVAQKTMDRAAFQRLAQVAHDLKITINDLLVKKLADAIRVWNYRHSFGTHVRITLPVNLRDKEQEDLSACNITGMYFVDFIQGKRTCQDVHEELTRVKKFRLASAFNRFVAVAGALPYGIRLLNRPPRDATHCQTSTCISNIGVIDDWWPVAPDSKATPALLDAFACAPLRPGTRMTFCFTTKEGALRSTVLADPAFFSNADAEQFLDILMGVMADEDGG